MKELKIIIIGARNIDKLSLAKRLIEKDDYLSIANTFTTDKSYMDEINDNYIQYIGSEDINLSYKNNALLYISTIDYISSGITMDEFYNNSILHMEIKDFNTISESLLQKNDVLVIWLDSKTHSDTLMDDIQETKYLIDRLDYTNYMYFLDEDYENISNIILEYLEADEMHKKEILEENL